MRWGFVWWLGVTGLVPAYGMTQLIHSALTRSVIGAFFEVYNTLGLGFLEHLYVMAMERELLVVETKANYELHKAAHRQLYNYLRATNLAVGLLFHFGPEPRFYRIICKNKCFDSPDPFHPQHPR